MKLYIDRDIEYPVYTLSNEYKSGLLDLGVDVNEEFYGQYLDIMAKYDAIQLALQNLWDVEIQPKMVEFHEKCMEYV